MAGPEIPYDLFAVVEHLGATLQQGHYKVRGWWDGSAVLRALVCLNY